MSRICVWLLLSLGGFLYWGLADHFAASAVDGFTGSVWFSGCALLAHWLMNCRSQAPKENDRA